LPPPLKVNGYALIDPGRYQPLNDDFSSFISAFKDADCEIVTGNMIPPDFASFWSQAAQQNFKPNVVAIGKALLFPSVIDSLGDRGDGLTLEIWWSPNHPFTSPKFVTHQDPEVPEFSEYYYSCDAADTSDSFDNEPSQSFLLQRQ